MQEPWFAVLQGACVGRKQASVARQLGMSTGAISQVLNGTGKYGDGTVLTSRIAAKVIHVFDRFECPHLTGESLQGPVVIAAAQCRTYSCRTAPTNSPREMQHWIACQKCPQRELAKTLAATPQAKPPTQATPQESDYAHPAV